MSGVIQFDPDRKIKPKPREKRPVTTLRGVRVDVLQVRVDGKPMTKQFFEQIQVKRLDVRPKNYYGWVMHRSRPWLLWTEQGRLYRSDIINWYQYHDDGSREPVTDCVDQIFIGRS